MKSYWLLCVLWPIASCYGKGGSIFWMRCERVNGAGSFSVIKTLFYYLLCIKTLYASEDLECNHQILLSPSHRWASLGFHFAGLNPISPVGLSGWPGEGRYPKHINWSLGFLRDRFLDPSFSPHTLHHWDPSYRHMASPTIATPMTHSSISLSTRWSNGSCTDLRLPGGHLGMDERTSPTAQPGKDWASCRPCHSDSTAWLLDSASTSIITPSTSVRNLGVIFDDHLTFKEHIAKTARSCRFALHNIRKIRPFLTEHAAQLLVQALVVSRLDYCNALLAGLPSNTIKPLQMIQNAAARLVFNEPKRTHVTPLFISLHWLPVAARIKFKTLMLAYRTTTGSAPSYFHSLLRIYIPSRSLRSASERRLVVPSQRGSKSLSRTFSFTIPGWWNNLPTPIRNAGSLSIAWHDCL